MPESRVSNRVPLPRNDIVRFGIVGLAALAIDGIILGVLVHRARWDPLTARVLAITVAGVFTWLLHRNWTFASGRRRPALIQSLIYGIGQVIAFSFNYLIFFLLVLTGDTFRTYPVLAVVVSSFAAMNVNYLLAKRVVFTKPTNFPGN